MLKRIFFRSRKSKKHKSKKSKKSKSNDLNISTDETNMNTYSLMDAGHEIDNEDDDEIDLPKLNFTCILNNPLENTANNSLFGQLLMKFQENQKIVTEEERIKKEGYKFDIIDIFQDEEQGLNNSMIMENKILKKMKQTEDEEEEELDDILVNLEQLENIFRSKKTLEQCIKETNDELYKNKKTYKLKKFVDLSYNNYMAKIKHEYLIYRENHIKNIIQNLKFEDVLNKDIKLGKREDVIKQINNYRKSLNDSMNLIDKEYKVDMNDFKIRENLLNSKLDDISKYITKLIEQKGLLELEAEKSNINYDLIKYFFRNNYPLMISQVDNMQFKVSYLVNKKNNIKTKFIDATQRMILAKIKRQNLFKLNKVYKAMKNAHLDKIETIKNILDIKQMKQKIKDIPNYGINIIKKINDELNKKEIDISSESENKITNLIKNEINNYFDIETYMNEEEEEEDEIEEDSFKYKYNYKYYNIDEKLYKKILKYKNNIKESSNTKDYIILIINKIDDKFVKEKIYTYLEQIENKEDYIIKIYNILLSSIEQVILTTLGKILPLKNMNEILYLFYIGKMSQCLYDLINNIFEEKEKEKLKNDINNKLFDIIDKNLSFIIDDLSSYNQNIDKFIIKNGIIKDVYTNLPIFIENKNFYQKVNDYEINFISYFGKLRCQKIKDGLNFDNFNILENISYEYQKLINVIFSFNENSFNQDDDKKFDNLKNNIILDIEITLKKIEPREINLIEIPKISEGKDIKTKCKLITTSLDIINDAIYTIKMLLFFSKKNYSKILSNFHAILSAFINLSNDIILETKGQIKNVTQNELASSYSSVYLIHEIASQFILFINSSKDIDENIKNKYNQLKKDSSDYMTKNLKKLNNMIKEGIKNVSLNEFKKIITMDKYPIIQNKQLPMNQFAENLVKLVKNVYKSLKNCYEDKTISKIILDNLNIFNNELEKLMDNKMELNEEERKQFKKYFTFIKKNIDNGDIDMKNFKKKLTSVYKKLLKGDDKEK
jgi:hypothetical protein